MSKRLRKTKRLDQSVLDIKLSTFGIRAVDGPKGVLSTGGSIGTGSAGPITTTERRAVFRGAVTARSSSFLPSKLQQQPVQPTVHQQEWAQQPLLQGQ
jgi:hypothetical protein